MSAPSTTEEFLDSVRKAELLEEGRLDEFAEMVGNADVPTHKLADLLVKEKLLTNYQAVQILQGKWDKFGIGQFRILERLGFGAVSNVYLCEHRYTGERVAIKVMTNLKAQDPVALKRFYREARAAASLRHANFVRVHDIDHDAETHFMVMDFVDGSSLHDIVQQFGPMEPVRAAHYVFQVAQGLQFAHKSGLVHRDIKPANVLIDRTGAVKILDMGLARFSKEEADVLTQGGEVLGAPEYLSPEQALDSHAVDIRADIYGLGATFYFLLAGKPPYSEEKTLAQKMIAKQSRPPEPIREVQPAVPEGLATIVETMMAQEPKQRYQTPDEVIRALRPWTKTPIPPPPEREMPQLSPAVMERMKAGKAEAEDPDAAPEKSASSRSTVKRLSDIAGAAGAKSPARSEATSAKTTVRKRRPAIPRQDNEPEARPAGGKSRSGARMPVPAEPEETSEEDEEETEAASGPAGSGSGLLMKVAIGLVLSILTFLIAYMFLLRGR